MAKSKTIRVTANVQKCLEELREAAKALPAGDLTEFIQNHQEIYPRILSNYSQLSQDNFQTPQMKCFLCQQVESCSVCPVNASLSGGNLGKIPSFVCEIQKIKIQEKERLLEEIHKNY